MANHENRSERDKVTKDWNARSATLCVSKIWMRNFIVDTIVYMYIEQFQDDLPLRVMTNIGNLPKLLSHDLNEIDWVDGTYRFDR